jgi:hypothetical protein
VSSRLTRVAHCSVVNAMETLRVSSNWNCGARVQDGAIAATVCCTYTSSIERKLMQGKSHK